MAPRSHNKSEYAPRSLGFFTLLGGLARSLQTPAGEFSCSGSLGDSYCTLLEPFCCRSQGQAMIPSDQNRYQSIAIQVQD